MQNPMEPTEPGTTVVEMPAPRRSKRGLVASLVVAGLLATGGSTFALWSATATLTGGTITAGDLNIAADTQAFYDVSPDRLDAAEIAAIPGVEGHAISDITTWRMVPGDKVATVMPATVTLEGDNLVADLTLAGLDQIAAKSIDGAYTYSVFLEGEATDIADVALPTAASVHLSTLAAPLAGQAAGASDAADGVIELEATTANLTVVAYNTFDPEVTGRTDVSARDVFANLTLKLGQTREAGA